MPFRGDEYWMAREFIHEWEENKIRSLPKELDKSAELPAIIQFKTTVNPEAVIICGTVDEWLQLREHFKREELAV